MNSQRSHRQFQDMLEQQPLHRGHKYSAKRKRSWVSLIIHIIVLILLTISMYSMWKEPIFNLVLVNEPIHFSQILNFQETLRNISTQNIDLTQINQLQDNIDKLKLSFYIFFFAGALSAILTILTLIFNRTVIKIVNMVIIAIMFVIPFSLSNIINETAKRVADTLSQYFLSFKPEQILTTADALNNAVTLLACCFGLLFISLFFRNRRIRIK
ncbi:hypothetical protein CD149_11420 [Staphylococcus condimenti]|uniref:Uncharacterized protein n=1 Tax=Staphylococcus condimenti TaxID=70255 RepID=A0A143PF53_9STAP|nr:MULTISPECIES: hypothetical protein [Staphylococcus]AMY06404.1 hypothetical protein A4G25_10875 [Staphylococcus condimenti]APR60286.1 hypothetical protein BTZ13_03290 [Staphylococcus condimenti]MDK8644254.1 hypothetical protein [Staphylococcus condimenti]OFP00248.1 hypothetical protein HMPREF3007_11720 [Staphylococcus sp. HMSC065E08]PNZ57790.1 hypothetical protein CD149_11420 [Staphylococcus condimenti]